MLVALLVDNLDSLLIVIQTDQNLKLEVVSFALNVRFVSNFVAASAADVHNFADSVVGTAVAVGSMTPVEVGHGTDSVVLVADVHRRSKKSASMAQLLVAELESWLLSEE